MVVVAVLVCEKKKMSVERKLQSSPSSSIEKIIKPAIGLTSVPPSAISFFNNLNRKISDSGLGAAAVGAATTASAIDEIVVHENFTTDSTQPFGNITKGFSMIIDAQTPLEFLLPDKLYSAMCVVEIAENRPDTYFQERKEKLDTLCICENVPSLRKLIGNGGVAATATITAIDTNMELRRGGVVDMENWDRYLGTGFVGVFHDDVSEKHFIGVYVPTNPVAQEIVALASAMNERPTLRFDGPNNHSTVGEFAKRKELQHAYQFSVRNALRIAYEASQLLGVKIACYDDDYCAHNLGEVKLAVPSFQSVFNTVDLSLDQKKVIINNRTISSRSRARYGKVVTFGGPFSGLVGMKIPSSSPLQTPSLFGRKTNGLHPATTVSSSFSSPIGLNANQEQFIENGVAIGHCHHNPEKKKFKKMKKRMHQRSARTLQLEQHGEGGELLSVTTMKPVTMYIGCGCGGGGAKHKQPEGKEGVKKKQPQQYHTTTAAATAATTTKQKGMKK